MNKKYVVRLEPEERRQLREVIRSGKVASYKTRRCQILLAVDESKRGQKLSDRQVAETLDVSVGSIEHLRKRFVEQGLEACLQRQKQVRPSRIAMFDGEKEAQLIALACSKAPESRERWSLRLLADKVVELRIVETTSHETVRRTLKKTR